MKEQRKIKDPLTTFIFGDLNFRNKHTFESSSKLLNNYEKVSSFSKKQQIIKELTELDEYLMESKDQYLENLRENSITFLPTYKYIPGTNRYDLREGKRIPSYTDRILYIDEYCVLSSMSYKRPEGVFFSDHKPLIFSCWVKIKSFDT